MRTLENAIPSEIAVEIDRRLDEIERNENVKILFAIESGSRAWGFPSPDSDFDVRFVYVRPTDWYLSLEEGRDVIELPIDGDYDINGWDLKKALRLLIKPNPVMLEWIRSLIVYRSNPAVMKQLCDLANRIEHVRPSQWHYLSLAQKQYQRFIDGKDEVKLKKYFYVLRPIMALMYMRQNNQKPVPMALPELRAGIDLSEDVDAFIDRLLKEKARTKELGLSKRIACLDELIMSELARTMKSLKNKKPDVPDSLNKEANALFCKIVREAEV